MTIIPLICRLDYTEQQLYLRALQSALPAYKICLYEDLDLQDMANIEVAIVANPDPQDLKHFTQLKWVHSLWAGVERLVEELGDQSFKLVRLVDPVLSERMSEAALAWCLYLHRNMPAYAKSQQNKHWMPLTHVDTHERTIGVLGLGVLGQASARRLSDHGFNVIGWSRHPKSIKNINMFSGSDGFKTLLNQTDILLCLLPLTASTRGLLNGESFNCLKPGANVINFARGAIIDTDDLIIALNQGQLSHAVLDVFENEPLNNDSPLWLHDNITVLPHISGPTKIESAAIIVADNISTYFESGLLPKTIDLNRGY